MLSDKSFDSSSAPVDKRGKPKKEKEVNPLTRYYHNEEEEREEEEEEDEERESGSEVEVSEGESSSTDDEDEYDFDDEEDIVQSDIATYLMAGHEDTSLTLTEQETNRLAVVNMDWDHIKAVDLYVTISSCLPKGGQILSVSIYPSEFGLKCMEVEAVRGPSALINNNEEHSEDESESEDENVRNEKLRTYELNKLSYYYGVVVFDSVATASHIYKNLDGTELLRTSNVFDLRFIPDSMEFKHPPRDMTAEPPTSYNVPDFHTRALQHSKVNLTWEEDEPNRTKFLKRKFNTDQLDELNEYLASSDSDASDEEEEIDGSENEDAGVPPDGKSKKHMHKEKLRALLLSGDGSGSDKDDDEDNDQEMEITFNTGLEDLSKRILEKKDKKSETVWEQVLRKRSEKRKARKNRSKYSDDDDDDSDSDVQEATDQPDDFFMEEEPSDSDAEVADKKKGDSKKSKKGKSSRKERKKSLDEYKDQEVSKAELELLFAEDQDGKGQNAKGYKIKLKKGKGKKGKEESLEAKLPDVDPSSDPRFSALFNSHLFALDPTDPQFKRSAAYARQKLGKQKIVKKTGQSEETANVPEQVEISNNDPKKKEKYELSSTVQSLKRNLGNLKKGTRSR
ncbi:pre-rRNA-processing protein esf1-like [Asparagus officinalis]|uniref:pre-rRNA-processing protein esf1-like n=1 Tax=Asparagus officinalis TaxID=4686 RepID=UPI00098E676B|nr:pre-rRNA-processing protein esf1-like [Asparagus officinalis]